MEAGHSLEEMLATVDHGIYAKRMGGGSVQPGTGEFNFNVQEAYLIEGGRITRPLKSATLIGTGLWWATPFPPLAAAGMSALLVAAGFFGGLVMSAIKRDRGVKDWGHMIEGHGGMLDRLDSVCFAAPIFFHFVRYWWVPVPRCNRRAASWPRAPTSSMRGTM